MMKVSEAIYYLIYAVLVYLIVKCRNCETDESGTVIVPDDISRFITIPFVAAVLCFVAIFIFTQLFQFFLTILAIQKFLLYFFPSWQKYIILSRKNMKYFIRCTYFFFVSRDVITFILIHLVSSLETQTLAERFDQIFFASINLSFFVSALLYIPILISVRKLSNLRSVQESKPQIYIFWQTMTALVVKIVYTSHLLYIYFDEIEAMMRLTRLYDAFSIPAVIMISYLTCNRRNVITLFSSFKGMKLIKEMIKPEVTTKVSPDPRRHRI
ncbi:hypothetical protein B9Z55_026762 [Caenorhabditis nigoni]|uniref:Serpentine receptor class gamma n=1 Tax=Caenorhabditis nigoni TaxID=1611254 RepID=A0A2G5SHC2_9PELO|nr:hypothetical protein B9Z55_026762 [Caenorhabditis nigoni]